MSKSGGVAAKMTSAATSAVITNHSGLHARPAVKLTKLAKRFDASVRMRIGEKGDWIDAKSVVKVMGMRAAAGETLYFAADGPEAVAVVDALVALTRRDFDEGSPVERQFRGQVASSGLVRGHHRHAGISRGQRNLAAESPGGPASARAGHRLRSRRAGEAGPGIGQAGFRDPRVPARIPGRQQAGRSRAPGHPRRQLGHRCVARDAEPGDRDLPCRQQRIFSRARQRSGRSARPRAARAPTRRRGRRDPRGRNPGRRRTWLLRASWRSIGNIAAVSR